MIQEVEEEEPTGFIRLEKLQPMMARVLMERRSIAITTLVTRHFTVVQYQCITESPWWMNMWLSEMVRAFTSNSQKEGGKEIIIALQRLTYRHDV